MTTSTPNTSAGASAAPNKKKKEILVGYGCDVDAVAGWLGSYQGHDSPGDISRGMFAGEVGVPRLLDLFDKFKIKTTWFIPGHSIETFPEQCADVVKRGHEVGLHGYSHENPTSMTPEQENDVITHSIDLITKLTGKKPTGYTAPWWEHSKASNELLQKHGIQYDHSQMHHDFLPYYVRIGDSWTPIDYSKKASEWMKPLVRGTETPIVEIPASWHVDDLPPLMFIKKAPNSHGFVNPRDIEDYWMEQFEWVYENMDYAVFPITIHPDVSGRPHVLRMHERIIKRINEHEGVRWCTFNEMAEDYRRRQPFKESK